MKTIYEHTIGGDGAMAGLYIEDGFVVEKVKYPIAKAAQPAHEFIDNTINSLEARIPGDWEKIALEPARVAAHAAIDKLTSGE